MKHQKQENQPATRAAIKKRLLQLQLAGTQTSKGEPLSFASIARTINVTKEAVSQTARGRIKSAKLRHAIERELRQPFWVRRDEE